MWSALGGRSLDPDDLAGVVLIDSVKRVHQCERITLFYWVIEARQAWHLQSVEVSL